MVCHRIPRITKAVVLRQSTLGMTEEQATAQALARRGRFKPAFLDLLSCRRRTKSRLQQVLATDVALLLTAKATWNRWPTLRRYEPVALLRRRLHLPPRPTTTCSTIVRDQSMAIEACEAIFLEVSRVDEGLEVVEAVVEAMVDLTTGTTNQAPEGAGLQQCKWRPMRGARAKHMMAPSQEVSTEKLIHTILGILPMAPHPCSGTAITTGPWTLDSSISMQITLMTSIRSLRRLQTIQRISDPLTTLMVTRQTIQTRARLYLTRLLRPSLERRCPPDDLRTIQSLAWSSRSSFTSRSKTCNTTFSCDSK